MATIVVPKFPCFSGIYEIFFGKISGNGLVFQGKKSTFASRFRKATPGGGSKKAFAHGYKKL
jgi:hypothetical protein